MDKQIDAIIEAVIALEKGYVNNPHDRGGETNYGITEAVALENGYLGAMKDMPKAFAQKVYRLRYIERPGFDKIVAINPEIGLELIDTGVNMGPHRAGEFLQRWLNGFNDKGQTPDLFVDGACGRHTRDALTAFLKRRGEEGAQVLLRALNCTQGSRYLEITESKKTQRAFLYGWVRARVVI